MYIKNNSLVDFGSLKLDTNAIELHSLSDEDIRLPYSGVLPRQMYPASSAYIYFNIQISQEVIVFLVVNMKNGKQKKCSLSASNEELISLLDKFFQQSREKTGLSRYCLGLWWAHYIDWKKVVERPTRLLNTISTLSMKDRNMLKEHIMDSI